MRARLDLSQEGRVIIMAKAMLIMDMPSNCYECELNNYHFCFVTDDNVERYRNTEYKPTWCPLREVPQKKTALTMFDIGEAQGYNACIDEILGGGE